jgi:hypothetical protein
MAEEKEPKFIEEKTITYRGFKDYIIATTTLVDQ